MDDWIIPKRNNVLFEGDKNISAFLLKNGALRRPGTQRFSLLIPGYSGQIGFPIGTSADGYFLGVWRMGEEFLVQVFFHRNEGRETHPETPMCISQDGLSVLLITCLLVSGTGRRADRTVLT